MDNRLKRLESRVAVITSQCPPTIFILDNGNRLPVHNAVFYLLASGLDTPHGRIVSVEGSTGDTLLDVLINAEAEGNDFSSIPELNDQKNR